MAASDKFLPSGSLPRVTVVPANLGRLGAAGTGSASLDLSAGNQVFASARLSGHGSLRATGHAMTQDPADSSARARMKQRVAAIAFAWLYLVVPDQTVQRLSGWATIIVLLLLVHDRYKSA